MIINDENLMYTVEQREGKKRKKVKNLIGVIAIYQPHQ